VAQDDKNKAKAVLSAFVPFVRVPMRIAELQIGVARLSVKYADAQTQKE